MSELYYRYHVFFCTNRRDDGAPCCADAGADELLEYAKQRTKDLNISAKGAARINRAGCFNRCPEGPVIVVYPEGVWYTYADKKDIDEIIDEHLLKGNIVERLRI